MSLDRAILAFAGFMILVSLVLSYAVSPYWCLFTAFTGFCPAAKVLRKVGIKPGSVFR